MITISRADYKCFQLQACWDDCHFTCLIDCLDMPITWQLRTLPFQMLAQSPAHCLQALSYTAQ